jgi:site-specific recombinase XerD
MLNNEEITMNNIIISNEYELSNSKLDDLSKMYIEKSLSYSTRKFYTIDLRIFHAWCNSMKINPLPASTVDIARFLAHEAARGIKPSTLIRRCAAIKMAHEAIGYQSPTQHEYVKSVLRGIKREKGASQNKKAPATAERMESMIAHCQTNIIGIRDKALLLLGFSGAFRRSELVALQVNDIVRTPEGIKVLIRRSKTDQEGKGHVIAILNGNKFRVVDVLNTWLQAAKITEGYIFRSIRKNGEVQKGKLSCRSVADIVKRYAKKAGLTVDDYSGHSLRSGFITSGAQAGADLFKLMEVSRHKKPETVLGYVRESKLFENHAGEKFL